MSTCSSGRFALPKRSFWLIANAACLALAHSFAPIALADGPTPDPTHPRPQPPIPMFPLFECTSDGNGGGGGGGNGGGGNGGGYPDFPVPSPGSPSPMPPWPSMYTKVTVYASPWSGPGPGPLAASTPAQVVPVSVLVEEFWPGDDGVSSGQWSSAELWSTGSRFVVLFGDSSSQLAGNWYTVGLPSGDTPTWPGPSPRPVRYAQATFFEAPTGQTQSMLCVEAR
jgi:hypothetical protein